MPAEEYLFIANLFFYICLFQRMSSLIIANLRNREYVRLYETLVAGSLFAVLGPKFLEIAVYPNVNKIIRYKPIDPESAKVELSQLMRLLLTIAYVFLLGYVLSRVLTKSVK